jgi:hypothetical protein
MSMGSGLPRVDELAGGGGRTKPSPSGLGLTSKHDAKRSSQVDLDKLESDNAERPTQKQRKKTQNYNKQMVNPIRKPIGAIGSLAPASAKPGKQNGPKKLESHLKKLEMRKFGDDVLAEHCHAKFQEAKKRLRHFVIATDMHDEREKSRLLAFFQHRPHTYTSLLKECFKARRAKVTNVELPLKPDMETRKFTLAKRPQQVENLADDVVEERAQQAIKRFWEEYDVREGTKIFVVLGQYADMRDALKAEGWVENPVSDFDDPRDYRVHAFHAAYTTKSKDAFRF